MQVITSILFALFFIAATISIPTIIALLSRKMVEWIVSVFIVFIFFFFYSANIILFFSEHQIGTFLTFHIIDFIYNYRIFILDHWPNFNGITLFGINFFGIKANNQFTSTIVPLIIFWLGSFVRFLVIAFVPHNKLREKTREYWLYITFALIFLFIFSNVSSWNILVTLLIFLLALLVIATGLQRVFIDVFILLFGILRILGREIFLGIKWLWKNLRYIVLAAIKVAKFLNNLFRRMREIYEKYVQEPFKRLYRKITAWQIMREGNIAEGTRRLDDVIKQERLD